MSVRSAESVTTVFTTASFSTGALVNADSLPTGVLYLNGTANGATVTVTNITTGIYKAAVTLPTLAVNDLVSLVISATVGGVAGGGKVWEDTKDVFAGAIPDVIAGGTGGLFIAGTNAATTVTTSFTTTFTGNLTGSVGSVTGAVGSVTGAVGSVAGNVGGNVAGSVASVTAGVNVTAFNGQTTVGGKDWYHAFWYGLSIMAGQLPSGAGSGTEAWQDFAGVTTVTFTVDIDGNRTGAYA